MCGQHCADGYQWVKLKKPIYRPTSQLPEFFTNSSNDAKPNKQAKKENLTYPSGLYNVHNGNFSLS